jgi:hypothetical protein
LRRKLPDLSSDDHPIALVTRKKHAGKDFLIIVNPLLTITNAVIPRRQRAIMAAEFKPSDWRLES